MILVWGYCQHHAYPCGSKRLDLSASEAMEWTMDETMEIGGRGDFGLWAIEAAKQIVSEQGFELARAARDGSEEDLRSAGNALGQAITKVMLELYDGLLDGAPEA